MTVHGGDREKIVLEIILMVNMGAAINQGSYAIGMSGVGGKEECGSALPIGHRQRCSDVRRVGDRADVAPRRRGQKRFACGRAGRYEKKRGDHTAEF